MLHSLTRDDLQRHAITALAVGIAAIVWWTIPGLAKTIRLQRIPRVGKASSWLGLNLTAIKKDFAKNGRAILYEGYMKVCTSYFSKAAKASKGAELIKRA